MGAPPQRGQSDSLRVFGRVLLPQGHLTIEAPRRRSIASIRTYRNPTGMRIFRYMSRRRLLHPDVRAEIESDSNNNRFTGFDLRDARREFGQRVLHNPPPPGMQNQDQWFPIFGVERRRNQVIYPGSYRAFRRLWRSVTL